MMDLKVVTPDGIIWEGSAASLNLKTTEGEITVLPNHISLVSTVEGGMVTIVSNGETFHAECSPGVLEVKSESKVILIANHCSNFVRI